MKKRKKAIDGECEDLGQRMAEVIADAMARVPEIDPGDKELLVELAQRSVEFARIGITPQYAALVKADQLQAARLKLLGFGNADNGTAMKKKVLEETATPAQDAA